MMNIKLSKHYALCAANNSSSLVDVYAFTTDEDRNNWINIDAENRSVCTGDAGYRYAQINGYVCEPARDIMHVSFYDFFNF